MVRQRHRLISFLVFLVMLTAMAPAANASPKDDWGGGTTADGLWLSARTLVALRSKNSVGSTEPKFKYDWTSYCSKSGPEASDKDPWCDGAVPACQRSPEPGPGPAVWVWRRLVETSDGDPVTDAPWDRVGLTCFPDLIPGRAPQLTMGHILQAFHDTPFSTAYASIQPVNLRTLVNLPTYFAATYPTAGYQPGEIDATTILGFRVEIRPTATSYTYHFGDGTTLGPTEDPGGPYPEGTIRHTYQRTDTYPVRVDTTYSGQFRVNGGQWIDIPDTVTIQGTTSQLQVLEAVTRLH